MSIDNSKLRIVRIEDIVQETPTVKTLVFKDKISSKAKAGQFLMTWIPRREELPLSVMIANKQDFAAITIRKKGYGSTALFNKKINEKIGIRGPYGNSFSFKMNYKKIVLVGGGTGLVPLVRLINYIKSYDISITVIVGAKTKKELFFVNLIDKLLTKKKSKLIVATEDGSAGMKGNATDALNEFLSTQENIDIIYTCGPELMMKKVHETSLTKNIRMEASIERYMKCGNGICSSCCINDKLVCIDGTVFNKRQLLQLSEFGIQYRNKAGILTRY